MMAAAENSEGHRIEAFHYRFHPAIIEFLTLITRPLSTFYSQRGN